MARSIRARRWRLPALGAVVVVAGVGWGVTSSGDRARPTGRKTASQPAATLPSNSPECDDIGGEELARTSRWRVVHTGDGGEYGEDDSPTPVVACDRAVHGPARVRVLGMAKVETDGGTEGGPYVHGDGAGGDIVLLSDTFYEQLGNTGGFEEKGYTTLFDLGRGASSRLPGAWHQRFSYFGDSVVDHGLTAFVGAAGGVATVYAQRDGRHARTRIGPLTLWDAAGRRSPSGAIRAFASHPGSSGAAGGLYYRTAAGATADAQLDGPADTSALRPDPKLAWRSMTLASEPREEEVPDDAEDEAGGLNSVPLGGTAWQSAGLWLRLRPSSTAKHRQVFIESEPGGDERLATLARASDHDLHLLDDDSTNALIVARFAAQPAAFRVALIGTGTTARQRAFFDLPATRRTVHQASAAVRDGVYALADATTLRVWNASGGHRYEVRGLHSLALAGDGVFGTDAQGRARLFGPADMKPPPANDRPNPPENADGPPPPNG